MLYYNTALPQMTLPEYGRNVQNMVDFCMTITDREIRTSCAHAIVRIVSSLSRNSREKTETTKNSGSYQRDVGFQTRHRFPLVK